MGFAHQNVKHCVKLSLHFNSWSSLFVKWKLETGANFQVDLRVDLTRNRLRSTETVIVLYFLGLFFISTICLGLPNVRAVVHTRRGSRSDSRLYSLLISTRQLRGAADKDTLRCVIVRSCWNSLPVNIWNVASCRQLKTYLFTVPDWTALDFSNLRLCIFIFNLCCDALLRVVVVNKLNTHNSWADPVMWRSLDDNFLLYVSQVVVTACVLRLLLVVTHLLWGRMNILTVERRGILQVGETDTALHCSLVCVHGNHV